MNFNLKEKFFTKIAVAVSVGILSAAGCPAGAAGMQTAGSASAVQEPVRFEGVVIDENRIPLAGASVAVADDLSVGTITDVDGKFSISVPHGTVLVVSFTGYKDASVEAGDQGFMEIQLIPDAQVLKEVVVTALGISRETKSLGYAMQEIEADGLQDNKAVSVANMLQGKIAGVQISQSGAGMGGATRIVLRGLNSLSGSNQPLWVVDGVPINDGTSSQPNQWGGQDYAGAASSINPEDIESISVLKGANAAALYGSRAQSGAIIITTKKGKYGQPLSIEYNGNVDFSTIYDNIYEFQNIYGQGSNGIWNGSALGGSWGARMSGQKVRHWQDIRYGDTSYGKVALEPQPEYIKDFYRTGVSYNNTVTASAGGEYITGRLSFTDSRNNGNTPNHSIKRQYYDLNTEFKNKWLTVGAKVNYMHETVDNAPTQGEYSLMNQFIKMPRGIVLADLENAGFDSNDVIKNWSGLSRDFQNPYGIVMPENGNRRVRDRIIGQIKATVTFTEWLNLTGRVGIDLYHDKNQDFKYYSLYGDEPTQYTYGRSMHREYNADLILNFNKKIKDFSIQANLGTSVYNSLSEGLSGDAGTFQIPDYYWMSNGDLRQASESYSQKEIQSVFGNVSLGYRDMVYLDITGRNDWSSTLPRKNWSYFYPSVSLSAIVSEMFEFPKAIDFLKLRASWAKVGNDTSPYQLDFTYRTVGSDVNATLLEMSIQDMYPLSDLKPEETQSFEVGLDYRMFNNRLGLDFTYYNSNTTNQILSITTSPTSGYTSRLVNAGKIKSYGFEAMLTGTPVLKNDWEWDVNINWGLNRTKCVELYDSIKRYTLGSVRIASVVVEEGGRFGDIVANNAFKRNENGQLLIDNNGVPVKETDKVIGNITPDWTGSVGTTLRWKGISLYALFDIRCGGDFISLTDSYACAYGNSARTLEGRDGMVIDGIVESTGMPNEKSVTAESYWTSVGGASGVAEAFMYDGSYVKLRELSLGWSLPQKWLRNTPLKSVKISAVGRDLWFLFKNAPVNPESAYSRSDFAQAFEIGSLPPTRTMGFSLNVKF